MSRGIKHDVDRMVEQLASLHMPWKVKDQNGNDVDYVVQAHLQPIQLWSYVVPKEHMETVIRTLEPNNTIGFDMPKGHLGFGFGAPKRKFSLAMLRKGLGLKPMPKIDPQGLKFPIYKQNVQIVGIGVKDDYDNQYGNEAL